MTRNRAAGAWKYADTYVSYLWLLNASQCTLISTVHNYCGSIEVGLDGMLLMKLLVLLHCSSQLYIRLSDTRILHWLCALAMQTMEGFCQS